MRRALRTRGFYALTLSNGLATFTYGAVLPHVEGSRSRDRGLSDAVVPDRGRAAGGFRNGPQLLFGYVAERITARRTLMLTLTGQCLPCAVGRGVSSPLVWVFGPDVRALHGFLRSALDADRPGGLRPQVLRQLSGMAGMASVVSMVLGPVLAGASADVTGSYGVAFVGIAAMFVVAALALSQLHGPRPKTATG